MVLLICKGGLLRFGLGSIDVSSESGCLPGASCPGGKCKGDEEEELPVTGKSGSSSVGIGLTFLPRIAMYSA